MIDRPLFRLTIFCIFCDHRVEDTDPQTGHDRMEAHYTGQHAELIARLAGEASPRETTSRRTAP